MAHNSYQAVLDAYAALAEDLRAMAGKKLEKESQSEDIRRSYAIRTSEDWDAVPLLKYGNK